MPNLVLSLNLNNTNLIYLFFNGYYVLGTVPVFREQLYHVEKIISLILQMRKVRLGEVK